MSPPVFSDTNESSLFHLCPVDSASIIKHSPPPLFSNELIDTTDISAEQVQNIGKSTSVFSGNVQIERHQLRLQADTVKHHKKYDLLEFNGNIHLDTANAALNAESGWLNIQTNESEFINNLFYMPEINFSGKSSLFSISDNQVSTIIDTQVSTCPMNKLDWHLDASWLELNQRTKLGTAKHTVFWLSDIPVFYFPWIQFPLGDERRSGFLYPGIGLSSSSGFEASTPYYWNIAPNQDAIITPTYLRDRGSLIGTNYRYLTHSSSSVIDVDYLNQDTLFNDEARHLFHLENNSKINDQLQFNLLLNDSSDSDYLQDLGGNINLANTTHLERTAKFTYTDGPWVSSLMAQTYQTIDDSIALGNRPYQRLPQITLKGENELIEMDNGYLVGALTAEWVEFAHDEAQKEQGSRLFIYPKISIPFEDNAWFITPSAGYSFTQYDTTDGNGGELDLDNRALPIFSLDSGLFFERDIASGSFLQTLEPRLFYLNVPFEDQSAIPIFDTAETDFSFASLFRENRFNGVDRIGDTNQLTLALSSRTLSKENGDELFNISIGQIYYFEDQRVSLNNTIDTARKSDIITEIGGRLNKWKARATFQWNTDTNETDKRSIQFNYGAPNEAIFNIGYRFQRDELDVTDNIEQTDLSFVWPITSGYTFLGRWNYSLTDEHDLQTLVGIEYESCCYAIRLVSQRYITDNNDANIDEFNSSIMVSFILKGFGSISGNKATDTLKQAILGYQTDY